MTRKMFKIIDGIMDSDYRTNFVNDIYAIDNYAEVCRENISYKQCKYIRKIIRRLIKRQKRIEGSTWEKAYKS